MATIVLQAVGSAVGTAIGGPIGGTIGRAAGALAGSAIDQRLFGIGPDVVEGPRLTSTRILASQEGAVVPQAFGRVRLSGQIIWATRFEEVVTTEETGGKGAPAGPEVRRYSYFANFALALCEGEIGGIGRVWADGREIEREEHVIRLYRGTDSQAPDALIEAKQGDAPAYRGTAYLVFERFPLEAYGNRVPQIGVEVLRPVGRAAERLPGVNVIPGATEHGYDPDPVIQRDFRLGLDRLNDHTSAAATDWNASIDALQASAPNLKRAALVVAWFGDDLRAERCEVQPQVETPLRSLKRGEPWTVGSMPRLQARRVSRIDGRPAYGGTPSDGSVLRAIRDLKARGLAVTYHPFVMMDVPPGTTRPSPYGGTQPAFPWRGRITCTPARGQPNTAWGTQEARAQIARFVGTAAPEHFEVTGDHLRYRGPDEWSFRRMILHAAHLCAMAGGVDLFMLGSEMRGLTHVMDETGAFPFVDALRDLARDVRTILPDALITYGADWSEYAGLRGSDDGEGGDVRFCLDPLWADPDIDCVGIDNYLPLSDWRDGGDPGGVGRSHLDPDMLTAGVAGGEYFDWFYASDADRAAGLRTPITDGLANEPWVYRAKDLVGWWSNPHRDRVDGVRATAPTAWAPGSKPIVFTELGCPAVDRGANQPNVFFDPKSSESALPHFSRGVPDDEMQAAYLEAHERHWNDATNNPVSSLAGLPMVDWNRTHVWAWDARPWPAFPRRDDVWSDGTNWRLGHWLNGRLGNPRIRDLIAAVLTRAGFADFDVTRVEGTAVGCVLADGAAPRGALEAIIDAYGITVHEEDGRLAFRSPGRDAPLALDAGDMVDPDPEGERPLLVGTRGQVEDMPRAATLEHVDPHPDFPFTVTASRRLTTGSPGEAALALPLVLDRDAAFRLVEAWLQRRWAGRDEAAFTLPVESGVAPGTLLTLPDDSRLWRAETVERGEALEIVARTVRRTPALPAPVSPEPNGPRETRPAQAGEASLRILDLPLLDRAPGENGHRVAIAARPWRGPYRLAVLGAGETVDEVQRVEGRATLGRLAAPLPPGPIWRIDRANALLVDLTIGALASRPLESVLDGRNAAAIRGPLGWEVVQFERAELIGRIGFYERWRLTNLLRGQGGTEDLMGAPVSADFVVLSGTAPLDEPMVPGRERAYVALPRTGGLDATDRAGATVTLGSRALLPFAPVHPRLERRNDGFELTWTRRDRGRADAWDLVSVPMSEATEAYRVSIRDLADGSERVEEASEPRLALPTAWLEGGTGGGPFEIAVSQLSAAVGPGPAVTITYNP